ncbi:multicopper oxidase domain-containing protein [Knoellia aerolata]|uniref:Copper-containing nitrite reductase n=1 Tax=Knoellia aerolata DSM 18566 TaxID=1385519 RepID=A0A0A0JX54_9MICO|nr:multicopper oxidase domain-containing protein [Knoellia aerolata]KGN41783.1 multicopper oxidase [Knoellia aerolata DSM 18566]
MSVVKPRVAWHLGANAGVLLWLVLLLVTTLVHPFVPDARWLMVHLLLLGAVTNAILVWSTHFAHALLKSAPARRAEAGRLLALNLGVAAVVVGMVTDTWAATLAGAVVVGGSVAAHGISLALMARRALPARFGTSVHHYVAASCALPVGAALGTLLARHPGEALHGRLLVAHLAANILGWVGLTVLGTLLTLWPTILRTRMAEGAERASRHALPVLVAGLLLVLGGALLGLMTVTAVGALAYLGAALWSLRPALSAARAKPPQSFAAWSVLAATGWLVVTLVWFTALVATAPDWFTAGERTHVVAVPLAVGFAAQVLLGALTHLVPVVLGGGPARVRELGQVLERGAAARVVLTNVGLAVCLAPVPSLVRVLVSTLVLGAMASFVVLLVGALRRSRRPVEPPASPPVRHIPESRAVVRGRHTGMAAVGLAAVVLATAAGVAADPAALGGVGRSAAGEVAATGETTTVRVEARGMRFHPASVTVAAGNRLVIEVVNQDTDVHDLALESGERSGRLSPGASGRVEVAVVGRGLDGWCTIAGHRQMGMLFTVVVTGGDAVEHAAHGTSDAATGTRGGDAADDVPRLDVMAEPATGFRARDATLAPAAAATVHRVDLTVREVEREVGVGVRQKRWTFDGTAPGPTLRGKVGDRFDVTLTNDGSIGHSIDFHAGSLAPDGPMRTIAPGASHTFSFTATRAGIWMYHCSTMPMSLHIANGMFGAVVIDPPDLPPVDREYLLVQSELYLGESGADPAKVAGERPDGVVFNGFASQYDHDQLPARVGERVRIWVLDAGPNRPSSFHVVGGQFDTVFSEGAWLLRPGGVGGARDVGGARGVGGAQALALMPAQGGFVELVLPEAGHYPFVSHVMVDAERGAHGILEVTDP